MYVITGATGNTGKIVAERLISKGQKVRVIGRSADRLKSLADQGAEPFICDITDAAALTKAFIGARVVYAMIPPDMASPDFPGYQDRVSDSIAAALINSQARSVVALSSLGADKTEKTGPVLGLHFMEEKLRKLPRLDSLCLRPAYFMENTLAQISMIQNMDKTAGPLRPDLKIPMIATRDIGAAAAEAMLSLNFTGHETRELLGQRDISMEEVTKVIGAAIKRPDLTYIHVPNDQIRPALLNMGMSESAADQILELSGALNSSHIRPLEKRSAANSTPTSFETFVKEEFLPGMLGKTTAA